LGWEAYALTEKAGSALFNCVARCMAGRTLKSSDHNIIGRLSRQVAHPMPQAVLRGNAWQADVDRLDDSGRTMQGGPEPWDAEFYFTSAGYDAC